MVNLQTPWELDLDILNQASASEVERKGAQGWGMVLGEEVVPRSG